MGEDILDTVRWTDALANLIIDCASADACTQGKMVRRLSYCIELAPPEIGEAFVDNCSESELDTLLDADAFESAVFRLLGRRINWVVSQNHAGNAIATTGLPHIIAEVSSENRTMTLALISASAGAMMEGYKSLVKSSADRTIN